MTASPTTRAGAGRNPVGPPSGPIEPRVPSPRQPITLLPSERAPDASPGRRALYPALRPFVLSSLIAFIAVAAATVVWGGRLATTEALGQAEATGRGVAEGIVAPLVTSELRAGDPAALAHLDALMRNRMSDGSIFRIKIWTADQRILYSDRADLIGRHYPLEHADLALLGTTNASAAISDLQHSENVDERGTHGQAVEVYAGFVGADGSPLIFEAYLPAGAVYQNAYRLERALLPLSLGSVTLLLALLMPLAVSMARRVERIQAERNRLLSASISSSTSCGSSGNSSPCLSMNCRNASVVSSPRACEASSRLRSASMSRTAAIASGSGSDSARAIPANCASSTSRWSICAIES